MPRIPPMVQISLSPRQRVSMRVRNAWKEGTSVATRWCLEVREPWHPLSVQAPSARVTKTSISSPSRSLTKSSGINLISLVGLCNCQKISEDRWPMWSARSMWSPIYLPAHKIYRPRSRVALTLSKVGSSSTSIGRSPRCTACLPSLVKLTSKLSTWSRVMPIILSRKKSSVLLNVKALSSTMMAKPMKIPWLSRFLSKLKARNRWIYCFLMRKILRLDQRVSSCSWIKMRVDVIQGCMTCSTTSPTTPTHTSGKISSIRKPRRNTIYRTPKLRPSKLRISLRGHL